MSNESQNDLCRWPHWALNDDETKETTYKPSYETKNWN